MTHNLPPPPVKDSGAHGAHGRILDPAAGSLYVHVHRENGLAHRRFVLKVWQVRFLSISLSRPMLALFLVGGLIWGWMATQSVQVPILQRRIAELTKDAERLDTLTARLTELQARYTQVQQMLGASKGTMASVFADSLSKKKDTVRRAGLPTTR